MVVDSTRRPASESHVHGVQADGHEFWSAPMWITYVPCSPPAAPTAGDNGPVCPGQTLQLTASTVAGATYSWTGPNGFMSAFQNPTLTATEAAAGPYAVTATVGGCPSPPASTTVFVNPDTTVPVVTPPSDVTVDQTLCCGTFGGTTSAMAASVAAFLSGGSATDDCLTPTRLAPQVSGADVTALTCFESGVTAVTFRYQDGAAPPNVGTATANVVVRMYGDLNLDSSIDAADMVILRGYLVFAISPGTPPFNAPEVVADVNHDGNGDATDWCSCGAI
jgi:hypothetical protein